MKQSASEGEHIQQIVERQNLEATPVLSPTKYDKLNRWNWHNPTCGYILYPPWN